MVVFTKSEVLLPSLSRESLYRLSLPRSPSSVVLRLCFMLFYIVENPVRPSFQRGDMWLEIRKFLRADDLELRLMCFSLPGGSVRYSRALTSLDEVDVIRSGEDACILYTYLRALLRPVSFPAATFPLLTP